MVHIQDTFLTYSVLNTNGFHLYISEIVYIFSITFIKYTVKIQQRITTISCFFSTWHFHGLWSTKQQMKLSKWIPPAERPQKHKVKNDTRPNRNFGTSIASPHLKERDSSCQYYLVGPGAGQSHLDEKTAPCLESWMTLISQHCTVAVLQTSLLSTMLQQCHYNNVIIW